MTHSCLRSPLSIGGWLLRRAGWPLNVKAGTKVTAHMWRRVDHARGKVWYEWLVDADGVGEDGAARHAGSCELQLHLPRLDIDCSRPYSCTVRCALQCRPSTTPLAGATTSACSALPGEPRWGGNEQWGVIVCDDCMEGLRCIGAEGYSCSRAFSKNPTHGRLRVIDFQEEIAFIFSQRTPFRLGQPMRDSCLAAKFLGVPPFFLSAGVVFEKFWRLVLQLCRSLQPQHHDVLAPRLRCHVQHSHRTPGRRHHSDCGRAVRRRVARDAELEVHLEPLMNGGETRLSPRSRESRRGPRVKGPTGAVRDDSSCADCCGTPHTTAQRKNAYSAGSVRSAIARVPTW